MKRKIDSAAGRAIYSMRLAVGEPPFAHIRSVMKLDRFTLRSKNKVDTDQNDHLFRQFHQKWSVKNDRAGQFPRNEWSVKIATGGQFESMQTEQG